MARKTVSFILAMLLVLSVFGVVPAMAASISTTVKTTNPGDTLYVRKGPHKGNTPTVGTVTNKQAITLISWDDEEDPESWSKIKVKSTGAVGYLKNKYIKYFGLSNRDGEIDRHEDDDWDYSDADDNDGRRGSGSGSSSGSTTSTTVKLGVVSTNGGAVNVRKTASTSGAKVGTARNGEHLDIKGVSGSWYKVTTARGLSGYIHKTYVSEGIPARTTASRGVNMRKGAGTGYSVIRSLPYDTYITVLSKSGSWSRIKVGSTYGYIYNSYYEYE